MSATTTALTETIPHPTGANEHRMLQTNHSNASKGSFGKDRPASLKSNADIRTGSTSLVDHNGRLATNLPTIDTKSSNGTKERITARPEGGNRDHSASMVDAITPQMRRREKVVFAAMCFALFLAGWCDGTTGPLLPRIQNVYGVGFAVVSIVFISGCVGFIVGALANVYWTDRYNFGTLMIVGSVAQVIASSVQASAPPFPVLCVMYALNGFGGAIQDAQANGLVASLHEHASEKMGLLHAIYGLGAFSSPLVSTQFAQLERWSFHFLSTLGIAVINTVLLVLTVRNRSLEAVLRSIGSPPALDAHAHSSIELANRATEVDTEGTATAEQTPPPTGVAQKSSMSQILGNMTVQLMALFILVYVGVEVTIGGWIVTFIIHVRGGGPSSGYVSSGFFGGLTVGRVALLWVNKKVGERRVIFIYAALAIGLELVIWFVPSLIGNAVAVSIVGVLLGPMYPLCMNHAGRVLPRNILTASIGWIAGFGQAGSAVIPFMTGALASRFGIKSLQPLYVSPSFPIWVFLLVLTACCAAWIGWSQ
ncbi:hypothetical protein FRC14_007433 [Serendipita sp. 396]|nr:hypothetical protein FRC14_007433 [Serendipita sp. 396]